MAVVGLGLTGPGIASCLVASGFHVTAFDRVPAKAKDCSEHIATALREIVWRRLLKRTAARDWRECFRVVSSVDGLAGCGFVIESVRENLQALCRQPERIIGMHWAEPAQITRYLEIIPGKKTSEETIRRTEELGKQCGQGALGAAFRSPASSVTG
ncbi:MAG: hypothetical protein HYZ57_08215 [Acidobacteria bacterium]|nr:hypothetical protein [Acidobacteriota bacterium]